jgi:uncharacterized membrane protein YcgQ (UPF0703/DUF1980 family)
MSRGIISCCITDSSVSGLTAKSAIFQLLTIHQLLTVYDTISISVHFRQKENTVAKEVTVYILVSFARVVLVQLVTLTSQTLLEAHQLLIDFGLIFR